MIDVENLFTMSNLEQLVEMYKSYGMLIGILLPFLEAFFPFLPLVVFVMANATAFGLLTGFVYSLIGSCLGGIAVFFLIRKFGQRRFFHFLSKHEKIAKTIHWIEQHGFGPIFLLFCFPFTPSVLIIIVAGLSQVSTVQFLLALLFGKMIMIFTISFIGQDLMSFIHQPVKAVIVGSIVFFLWLIGKKLENKFNLTKY